MKFKKQDIVNTINDVLLDYDLDEKNINGVIDDVTDEVIYIYDSTDKSKKVIKQLVYDQVKKSVKDDFDTYYNSPVRLLKSIDELIDEGVTTNEEINSFIEEFKMGDWGNVSDKVSEINDNNIDKGKGDLVGRYEPSGFEKKSARNELSEIIVYYDNGSDTIYVMDYNYYSNSFRSSWRVKQSDFEDFFGSEEEEIKATKSLSNRYNKSISTNPSVRSFLYTIGVAYDNPKNFYSLNEKNKKELDPEKQHEYKGYYDEFKKVCAENNYSLADVTDKLVRIVNEEGEQAKYNTFSWEDGKTYNGIFDWFNKNHENLELLKNDNYAKSNYINKNIRPYLRNEFNKKYLGEREEFEQEHTFPGKRYSKQQKQMLREENEKLQQRANTHNVNTILQSINRANSSAYDITEKDLEEFKNNVISQTNQENIKLLNNKAKELGIDVDSVWVYFYKNATHSTNTKMQNIIPNFLENISKNSFVVKAQVPTENEIENFKNETLSNAKPEEIKAFNEKISELGIDENEVWEMLYDENYYRRSIQTENPIQYFLKRASTLHFDSMPYEWEDDKSYNCRKINKNLMDTIKQLCDSKKVNYNKVRKSINDQYLKLRDIDEAYEKVYNYLYFKK